MRWTNITVHTAPIAYDVFSPRVNGSIPALVMAADAMDALAQAATGRDPAAAIAEMRSKMADYIVSLSQRKSLPASRPQQLWPRHRTKAPRASCCALSQRLPAAPQHSGQYLPFASIYICTTNIN